jgi:hypothetical protein
MTTLRRAHWIVDRTWDGLPIDDDERARVMVELTDAALRVEVDAPYYGDPAPPGRPGSVDGLWEYEVVELFLVGSNDHYLEIELSPHGHHLVLALHGERRQVATGLPARVEVRLHEGRWRAEAELDPGLVPARLHAGNAFAIHGLGEDRRYLVAHPTGGSRPDFHRIATFPTIDWQRHEDK